MAPIGMPRSARSLRAMKKQGAENPVRLSGEGAAHATGDPKLVSGWLAVSLGIAINRICGSEVLAITSGPPIARSSGNSMFDWPEHK